MLPFLVDATFGYLIWGLLILAGWSIFNLLKKNKVNKINYKTVCLASLIGVFPPSVNLINGRYQTKSTIEMSASDQEAFKKILLNCLSGQQITKDSHTTFYGLVDKYSMSTKEINEIITSINIDGRYALLKAYYEDAIKTIQTKKISESKIRLDLENEPLNKSQKKLNNENLKKILANEPIDIDGESVVLTIEICELIIANIPETVRTGKINLEILRNREFNL
jgi:replication initiation and membrane attachment protein DnaB